MAFHNFKYGQPAGCNECATFANQILRSEGHNTRGDAWELKNKSILFSGYNPVNRPKTYDKRKVEKYNLDASRRLLKEFDSETLNKEKKYIVNMFYKGSNFQEQAFNNDTDDLVGTHEGLLVFNNKKNRWDVVHNIHGTVYVDDFINLQKYPGKYGVTAVMSPEEQDIMDKLWTGFKNLFFDNGGKINRPIYIGNKKFNVTIVRNELDRIQGLRGVKSLEPNEGMLFDFEGVADISMTMEDTLIPLDIVFIDNEFEVVSVQKAKPNSPDLISEDDIRYVLEVNQNSGIEEGDKLDFTEYMEVLDEDGEIQMKLEGGERIVSRKETKVLIKKAKRINKIKQNTEEYNKACKDLGKYLFNVFKKQDSNDIQYVE